MLLKKQVNVDFVLTEYEVAQYIEQATALDKYSIAYKAIMTLTEMDLKELREFKGITPGVVDIIADAKKKLLGRE